MAFSQETLQQMVNNAASSTLNDMLWDGSLIGLQGPPCTATSNKFSPKEIGFFSPRLDEREGKRDIAQIGSDTMTNFEKETLRIGPIKLWYDRLEDK
jgi:hypothetical protein